MRSFQTFAALALALFATDFALAFTSFQTITLRANDLVYDPHSDMIYASVPSIEGAERGNTITPIDPHTGALGTSVFVCSEPSILALAEDGSQIYVASDSTNLVTPFSLQTMSPQTAFPIGSGDRRVDDMEVAPGQASALAVSRRMGNNNKGIAFFLDGVQLPNATTDSALNDVIEFGDSPADLFGHANSFSQVDFNLFTVDFSPGGGLVSQPYHVKYLVSQTGLDMEYADGRMYFTNGQVLDVSTPGPIGSFAARGPLEPVAATNRTYFVQDANLLSFSQSTFVPLGNIPVPDMAGGATNLIALGEDGLAWATSAGQVIIARGSLVLGPTGDFDQDGSVAGDDFLIWQRNVGSGSTVSTGDADGNGAVNAADLAVWRSQYGVPPPAVSVPEPGAIGLAVVAGLLCGCRQQRCRPTPDERRGASAT